ncbi:MAG TPA: sulfur carrier protein ThiS [Hyphomicrobiales bacterium]|nr:sulfur carrier protein ThiS [Hyphomicrobiales bacterium]
MNVVVNGEALCIDATTLAALLAQLGYAPASVATAVDGEFVPRAQRAGLPLRDGMTIDVVAPIQGG